MALINIDYGLGQDDMQGVFDKTNLTIDLVNAIDNWQIADKTAIFANLTDNNATRLAVIDNANALYNNKFVILNVELVYDGLAETGGDSNGASFEFNLSFVPVGNLVSTKDWVFNSTDLLPSNFNGIKEVTFGISDSTPIGSFVTPRLFFYSDSIGNTNSAFRVVKTFFYKLA
jgi:hypothetical protein